MGEGGRDGGKLGDGAKLSTGGSGAARKCCLNCCRHTDSTSVVWTATKQTMPSYTSKQQDCHTTKIRQATISHHI